MELLVSFIIGGLISAIIVGIIITVNSHNNDDNNNTNTKQQINRQTYKNNTVRLSPDEVAIRAVGQYGEAVATGIIRKCLYPDDYLLTNIQIRYYDKKTEFDNIIVNKYGVFIIETKNYNGTLVGNVDDYEWKKYKTTDAGNTYEKSVKNPIKQVKRQIHILSSFLKYYGIDTWIRGYAILLQGNSPVNSEYILKNQQDIIRVIHTQDRKLLSKEEVDSIYSHLIPRK